MLRLGRYEESHSCLQTVAEEKPVDDSTLQVLSFCYREMEQRKRDRHTHTSIYHWRPFHIYKYISWHAHTVRQLKLPSHSLSFAQKLAKAMIASGTIGGRVKMRVPRNQTDLYVPGVHLYILPGAHKLSKRV